MTDHGTASVTLNYYHGVERLRYVGSWLVTLVATVAFGTLGILVSFVDPAGRFTHACARAWGKAFLWICGIELHVRGLEKIDPEAAYVFVANHQSALDIPALLVALPSGFRMLAKSSLFRIPFLGWYMSRVGYVPIDRADPRGAVRNLSTAVDHLGRGTSMLVFAEGTRKPQGQLGRFKTGGFHLAREARLPIVPIALINSGRLLPSGARWPDPGIIEIRVGAPVSAAADTTSRQLADAVHDRVQALAVAPGH